MMVRSRDDVDLPIALALPPGAHPVYAEVQSVPLAICPSAQRFADNLLPRETQVGRQTPTDLGLDGFREPVMDAAKMRLDERVVKPEEGVRKGVSGILGPTEYGVVLAKDSKIAEENAKIRGEVGAFPVEGRRQIPEATVPHADRLEDRGVG